LALNLKNRLVPAYGRPVEDLPPQPYQYEYGVSDQYSGSNYQAVESQDPQGTVVGKNPQLNSII
jgi:hypothetical protein